MERFILKKLNCVEVKEQYQVKISKYICISGKLGWWCGVVVRVCARISRAWESSRENMKASDLRVCVMS